MHSLTVVARITARAVKEQQTQQALEALVPVTQSEEGCMQYDLHVSGEAPGVLSFVRELDQPGAVAETHTK